MSLAELQEVKEKTPNLFENDGTNSELPYSIRYPNTNKSLEKQFLLDNQQQVVINNNTFVARIGKFTNSELTGFGIEVNAEDGYQIFAGTWTRGQLSNGMKLFINTMTVQYIDR